MFTAAPHAPAVTIAAAPATARPWPHSTMLLVAGLISIALWAGIAQVVVFALRLL
jgi:hypothetical protein